MKIGYITKQSPLNRKAYSGSHYYMYKALKQNFEEVVPFGPIDTSYKIIPKIKGRLLRLVSGKIYKYQYDVELAKRMAAIIDEKIKEHNPDVLLASLMNPEMAYLKSNLPLYLTTDATFNLLNEVYGSHSNLHPYSIKEAIHLEKKAFEKATKLILPLNWLADSVINDYQVPANKVEVIHYGANLDTKISEAEVDKIIDKRQKSPKLKLLFVGIRWEEKGGPFAVEVLRDLVAKGIDAELQIVGCNPVIADRPEQIKIIGFLDKESKEGADRLHQLYKEATFFIMPTKAECVGMSFIEAASYGLPAIGSKTGGVPEAVSHKKSGYVIEEGDNQKDVAEWILSTRKQPEVYSSLAKRAYSMYAEDMNWSCWGKRFRKVVQNELEQTD